MFSDNHKISLRQLQAMLLLYFLGTSSLFLPAEMAAESGRACYLSMLFGGLLAAVFSLVLTELIRRVPAWTGIEWMRDLCGQKLGTILSFGFVGKLLVDAILEVRIFCEILQRTMLSTIPLVVLMGALLLLCAFGMCRGIEGQARTAEILFFFVFPPLILLLIGVAFTVKQAYFLPFALPDFHDLRRGAAMVQPLFQAMLFLLFIPPFLQKPQKTKKRVFGVCLFTTLLLTAITFLCLTIYGVDALTHKIFPTLQMTERVSISGIFLGRQDIFLLWFWMVSAFLYLTGALFFCSVSLSHIFPKTEPKQRYWVLLLLPVVFIGAILPQDMETAYHFRNLIQPFVSAVYLGLFPVLFLCKAIWKERREKRA